MGGLLQPSHGKKHRNYSETMLGKTSRYDQLNSYFSSTNTSRPSSFSECTSASSAVGQSTATSTPNVNQQAEDMLQAIRHNPSLLQQFMSLVSCFGPNGGQAAQGQSSQASGNNGPQENCSHRRRHNSEGDV